ncbi:MAG: hypothetical protein JKY96_01205, partial [Phycisphaerales bacterium]|nr:hypothetical protein [Phycisphaerales bacterium]
PLSLINATVLCIRPIGVTSDFCPVCRCERRFHLAQAEHRRYTLCFDGGRSGQPHHELTCFVCACKVERPAEERPIEILPDPKSAGTYEPTSLPIVRARIEGCVAMEEELQSGNLKGLNREEMIRHTLYAFARIYDEEPTERIKPWVRMLVFIAIVAMGTLGVMSWHQSGHWWPLLGAAIGIGAIIIANMYWITTHSPRKQVRTWLAQALVPVDPTREEIRRARAEMQAGRINAGFRIHSDKVLAKIQKLKAKPVA